VAEQLLTFLVLRTREECADKRFDGVTRFCILKGFERPARHTLRIKLLFPPCGLAKEGHEFVRNVLETSAAESPQYVSKCFVFIHRLCLSTGGVSTVSLHEPLSASSVRAPPQPPGARPALPRCLRASPLAENGGDRPEGCHPSSSRSRGWVWTLRAL
jgi:hypothetical protein